jgi:CBS domain-containing protein
MLVKDVMTDPVKTVKPDTGLEEVTSLMCLKRYSGLPVITISPDLPILKAVSIMARNNFRRIPVAEGDKLIGMLSLGDIHRAIFMKNFTG